MKRHGPSSASLPGRAITLARGGPCGYSRARDRGRASVGEQRVANRSSGGAEARIAIEQVLAAQVGVPLAAEPVIELRYEELRLRPRGLDQRVEA